MITAPGIYDLTREQYDADPAPTPSLNQSLAKVLLDRSPAHAWVAHPRLNKHFVPEPQATKFDMGQAIHELLLGDPDRLAVVDADDWRTKKAKAQRAKALEQGRLPVLVEDHALALDIADAVRGQIEQNEELAGILDDGEAERSMFWQESEFGIWCRSRPDAICRKRRICLDLKTTSGTANPERWSVRQMYDIGADIQSAFYPRGLKALTGEKWTFRFAVVETDEPFGMSILALDPAALDQAEKKVAEAMRIWGECNRTGRWVGYPRHTCFVGLPVWQERSWSDRMARREIYGADELELGMEFFAPDHMKKEKAA